MRCYAEVAPAGGFRLDRTRADRFGSNGDPTTLEKALSNELAGLAQQLQADDGIEQLALNLLDASGYWIIPARVSVSPMRISRAWQ